MKKRIFFVLLIVSCFTIYYFLNKTIAIKSSIKNENTNNIVLSGTYNSIENFNNYIGKWICSSETQYAELVYSKGGTIIDIYEINERILKGSCIYVEYEPIQGAIEMDFIAIYKNGIYEFDYDKYDYNGKGKIIVKNENIFLDFNFQSENISNTPHFDSWNNTLKFNRPERMKYSNSNYLPNIKGEIINDENALADGELPDGCSWYCLGDYPYKIISSSSLQNNNKITYDSINTHDGDLKTAWVEGEKDYGIGQYIEYYFIRSPEYDSINNIFGIDIFNGYRADDKLWMENSRVKKIKVLVNDKPCAILLLADTKMMQRFCIGSIPLIPDKEVKLRFEVMEIYKGEKYSDTAISEISFWGLGH